MKSILSFLSLFSCLLLASLPAQAAKTILFIAGPPSHANGEHEFRAGCTLLANALNASGLDIEAKVHAYGWPKDESIFDGVDACIIYADAGGRLGKKVEFLDQKIKAGMGIMFMHYGVHPSKDIGEKYFKPWIGGFMETGWSVNPHWIADVKAWENHPVAHGLDKPFSAYDEFYWNMRFPTEDECDRCHPLATAVPTPEKVVRYINLWNEHGEKGFGTEQALMWCRDPAPEHGGRGIGFVGGHYHRNWAIDEFRKLVLNAIVWLARAEVPPNGVPSRSVTLEMLNENLDRPEKDNPIQLPTPDLLLQKPMPLPDLKARAAAKQKAQKKKALAKKGKAQAPQITTPLYQSPIMRASDKQRSHELRVAIKGHKQIELLIDPLGDKNYDWANWISPTFVTADGKKIAVDKKHVVASQQAWKSLAYDLNIEGKALTVAGKKYPKGLGCHAQSSITLNVPDGASHFTATMALDDGGALRDNKPTSASVQFFVAQPGFKPVPKTVPTPQANSDWQSKAPRHVDLEYFKVPEGLEVTLWANSPHLYNPTNIDIDHKGRIWVAEGVNYRRHNGRRAAGDRIAVLEDTDGDGTCDRSHTFVQEKGLIAPLGVAVFDNVVVVSQPPDIIVYTDVNRDLKFDPAVDKREVLLSGFNAINHDHSLHSVTSGPDGKWYFNNGNCGAIFTDKSGKTFRMGGAYKGGGGAWPVDNRAVAGQASDDGFVWTSGFSVRMNPDGTHAEIIGHGYRNSYEHCTTSTGTLFQNDNDDPQACRVSYVLEYGCAGYFSRDGKRSWQVERRPNQDHARAHWRQDDPGTFDMGDITGGGSPTGIAFYENGALGEKWNGLLLSAEAGKNVIFGYQPTAKGATYQLDRSDFCTTNPEKNFAGSDFVHAKPGAPPPTWKGKENPTLFRPSDVMVGPDGALYVSDWFDDRVGGHGDRDESCSGSIYRIAPKGFKPEIPKMDLDTTAGQITALSSPANNVRFLGFNGLKKGGETSLPSLLKLLKHPNKWIAARAIWILPHLGEEGLKQSKLLLTDEDPERRITAYRALQRADIDIMPFAPKLATDPNPGVRREVALSMRGKSAAQAAPILLAVAKGYDGKDKNYLEAIGLGAENQEDAVWKAFKPTLGSADAETWSDAFARLTWRLWPVSAIPDLKARALSNTLSPEQRAFAVESIAFINHRQAADAMLALAEGNSPVKAEASYWLLKRGTGEWQEMDLMKELARRDIYNPAKIEVAPVTVAAPTQPPKFSVEDVLALKGDASRGKATINRCVMCHQVGELGPNYGPFLQGWGLTQSPEVIARSIIEPSADIAHGYGGVMVRLKTGGEVQGLMINNSNPYIMKSTGGLTQMIPHDRVVGKPQSLNRSLMLSADQLRLSTQDVADLVEYMKQWK